MAPSHVDGINVKTWTFSIVCAILTYVNVSVQFVAMNFPGLGYPCVYYHIVDYDQFNMTLYNEFHQLTPQLYLDSGQMVAYVTFTHLVFLTVLVYYVVCWVKIFFRKDEGLHVNQATRDITYMGDSLSCFLFILCMDTFQLYTIALSFRLPSMVAFTDFLFFACLSAYAITLLTQYQNYDRWSFALSKIHPKLTGTVKFKTAIVNLVEVSLGFSTMVLAMSLCLGFGNNFFVKTGYMVFGALTTFAVIAFLYLIIIETVLYRYMKVQMGYHIGVFLGLCGALYPVIRYENIAGSSYAQGIHIFIAIMFLVWLAFTLCRLLRFFLAKQRRYRPLPDIEEIKTLKRSVEG